MIYELTRKATRQIEAIIEYTDTNFGAQQTVEYIDGLYQSFDILTDNPRMGRSYDATRRRYVYRSHHIYYRIEPDKLVIVDIRHTRQSPP